MSAENVTADVVVVTETGAVPNTGPTSIMGEDPIFPQARAAVTVPTRKSGSGAPSGESATDVGRSTATVTDLAKKGVGPEVESIRDQTTKAKLPSIQRNTEAIATSVMTALNAAGIISLVASWQSDGFTREEQMVATSWLRKLRPFNILTKQVEDDAGLSETGIVPFHVIAITCLLKGQNPSYLVFDKVIDELEKIKSYALQLGKSRKNVANQLLEAVFKADAGLAHRTYFTLLYVSRVDGMCTVRFSIIMDWLNRLRSDVDKHFDIIQREMMITHMQSTILLYGSTEYDALTTENSGKKLNVYA